MKDEIGANKQNILAEFQSSISIVAFHFFQLPNPIFKYNNIAKIFS